MRVRALIVVLLAALAVGGCASSGPQPGDPSGADVSIRGCDLALNPDGTIQALATVHNSGSENEQGNVKITLHWYGGGTDDNSGILGPPGYSLPPGTQHVAKNFNDSSGKTPYSCTASLQ